MKHVKQSYPHPTPPHFTTTLQICLLRLRSTVIPPNRLTHLIRNRPNRRSRMPTNLLRENTSINHPKPIDAMHATLQVHHAVFIRRAHPRCANRVVQRKRLFLHEWNQLLIGDIVNVAARVRPPVIGRVVVVLNGLEKLL